MSFGGKVYAVLAAVADGFAVDVDGVRVAVFPPLRVCAVGIRMILPFKCSKAVCRGSASARRAWLFHVGDAEPTTWTRCVCGFKDAVDAFQVFLRPFVGSEFEVAFADGKSHGSFGPRKTASTLISGCFSGFLQSFSASRRMRVGQPRALFAEVDGFDAVLLFQAFLHEGGNALHQRVANEKDFVAAADGGGVGVLFPFLDFTGLRAASDAAASGGISAEPPS